LSLKDWRLVKDPVDAILGTIVALCMGGAVAVICYAILRSIFG
jgi:hypothetical protein